MSFSKNICIFLWNAMRIIFYLQKYKFCFLYPSAYALFEKKHLLIVQLKTNQPTYLQWMAQGKDATDFYMDSDADDCWSSLEVLGWTLASRRSSCGRHLWGWRMSEDGGFSHPTPHMLNNSAHGFAYADTQYSRANFKWQPRSCA